MGILSIILKDNLTEHAALALESSYSCDVSLRCMLPCMYLKSDSWWTDIVRMIDITASSIYMLHVRPDFPTKTLTNLFTKWPLCAELCRIMPLFIKWWKSSIPRQTLLRLSRNNPEIILELVSANNHGNVLQNASMLSEMALQSQNCTTIQKINRDPVNKITLLVYLVLHNSLGVIQQAWEQG